MWGSLCQVFYCPYIFTLVGQLATPTGYVGKNLLNWFQIGFDKQHIDFYDIDIGTKACVHKGRGKKQS